MLNFNVTDVITLGKFIFEKDETITWDNNRYSKSWHRKFGGVKEVSNRTITIYKKDGRARGGRKQLAVVPFDAWRGNVLLAAIKQSGLFTVTASKAPLSVRLDKFYDAKCVRTIGNIKIWHRTLLGEHVDYCAVVNGVTFHAYKKKTAVKGLCEKIKKAAQLKNEPISYKLCKELGFCDPGIRAFCDDFGLDIKGTYSPEYIESIVKARPDLAAPFAHELRVVAKALNYQPAI